MTFLRRQLLFWLCAGLLIGASIVQAQENDTELTFFYFAYESLGIEDLQGPINRLGMRLSVNGEVIELGESSGNPSAVWNADGTQVAILGDSNIVYTIETGERTYFGRPPLSRTIAWTAENDMLLMREVPFDDTFELESPMDSKAHLYQMTPGMVIEDDEASIVSRFGYGTGCGGGTDIPVQAMYNDAVPPRLFASTSYGIIHQTNCAGGLALFNPETDERTPLPYRIPALSTDRSRIAGTIFEDGNRFMTVLDLATMEETSYPIPLAPTSIVWNDDDEAIYFATQETVGDLVNDLNDDEVTILTDIYYGSRELDTNTVQIHRLDLATGDIETIYNADAYGIARMYVVDDTLYLVEVPNQDAWLAGLLEGSVPSRFYNEGIELLIPTVHALPTDDPSNLTTLGRYWRFVPYTGAWAE